MSNIKDHPEILNKYYGKYAEEEPLVLIFETEQERNDWVNSRILFGLKDVPELRKMIVTPEQLQALLRHSKGDFDIYEPNPESDHPDSAFRQILISPIANRKVDIPIRAIYQVQNAISQLRLIFNKAIFPRGSIMGYSPREIDESFDDIEYFFQKYFVYKEEDVEW